jgi:hypothetical protein
VGKLVTPLVAVRPFKGFIIAVMALYLSLQGMLRSFFLARRLMAALATGAPPDGSHPDLRKLDPFVISLFPPCRCAT